jgi:prevent-host-death family protein
LPKKLEVYIAPATEAKNRFGEIIKRAYSNGEHIIVERGGIPVVAIVPIQDYERLIAGQDLSERIAQGIVQSSGEASARTKLSIFLAEAQQGGSEDSRKETGSSR